MNNFCYGSFSVFSPNKRNKWESRHKKWSIGTWPTAAWSPNIQYIHHQTHFFPPTISILFPIFICGFFFCDMLRSLTNMKVWLRAKQVRIATMLNGFHVVDTCSLYLLHKKQRFNCFVVRRIRFITNRTSWRCQNQYVKDSKWEWKFIRKFCPIYDMPVLMPFNGLFSLSFREFIVKRLERVFLRSLCLNSFCLYLTGQIFSPHPRHFVVSSCCFELRWL